MNRIFRRAIVLPAMMAVLLLSAIPCLAWKFASIADSRGSDNGVNTKVFSHIIELINKEKVDLVLFQGDAVGGSSDPEKLGSQMDTWLSIMKNLNCPWYYTPGNHEERSLECEKVLREKVDQPLNGPPGHEELVFSFDHENAHFAVLNSDHPGEVHRVQTDWLAADLSKTGKPHLFVMAHDPAYPAGPHARSSLDAHPEERDRFWNVLKKNGVGIYFCGHEHLYARTRHENVYQVINGSCGAPLYRATNAISRYHYVIVDIDGSSVRCRAKDDNGNLIDAWDYVAPVALAVWE